MTAIALPSPFAAPRPVGDPRADIRIGASILGLFVVGFVGWSAVARLDAAVHAPGLVSVAGSRQAVQSATGGVISAIHVREGSPVRAGDVLIEFASSEAIAQERVLTAKVVALQAEIARIAAEQSHAAVIAEPAEWATLDAADRAEAHRALALEQANLQSERRLISSQIAVLGQRIDQAGEQIAGYRERQSANSRQDSLNREELDTTQTLFSKGYATKGRVLALQRSGASIQGEMGATAAEIARLRSSVGETRLQMLTVTNTRQQQNADRLREARGELETAMPQWKAAREQLERYRLRASVSGTVIGLSAHTVGGVASPGQMLMEIVPAQPNLVVEAQVSPSDANDLRPGQPADIRITNMRGRSLPTLHGTVARVSADSLTDAHTGRAYFTETITVSPAELQRVSRTAGVEAIKPGTPVDVSVALRSRTALQYWIEPLSQRLSGALSEN